MFFSLSKHTTQVEDVDVVAGVVVLPSVKASRAALDITTTSSSASSSTTLDVTREVVVVLSAADVHVSWVPGLVLGLTPEEYAHDTHLNVTLTLGCAEWIFFVSANTFFGEANFETNLCWWPEMGYPWKTRPVEQ